MDVMILLLAWMENWRQKQISSLHENDPQTNFLSAHRNYTCGFEVVSHPVLTAVVYFIFRVCSLLCEN